MQSIKMKNEVGTGISLVFKEPDAERAVLDTGGPDASRTKNQRDGNQNQTKELPAAQIPGWQPQTRRHTNRQPRASPAHDWS